MNISRYLRQKLKSKGRLTFIIAVLYNWGGNNKKQIYGKNNVIIFEGNYLKKCRFYVKGDNNLITIEKKGLSRLDNLNISIHGTNNKIIIGKNASCNGLKCCIEDDNGSIILGHSVKVSGNTELAVIEGTSIVVGNECMFSANITLRTGDSHSILNKERTKRINPSQSIYIGEHVWIGNTVLILKGAMIEGNSIVAGGSVVTGKKFPSNSIIGGNPAKIIKTDVDWDEKRL